MLTLSENKHSEEKHSEDKHRINQTNFCLLIRRVKQSEVTYSELKKRERRYRTLSYFSSSVFGDNTIDAVLWDIAKNCIAELGFEDAIVYWLDTERQVLVQKAAYGDGKVLDETIVNPIEIPIGKGIVGTVAQKGVLERIPDTSLDSRYIVDDAIRCSELTVPIKHKETVLGVIDSEHSQKNFFTDEDEYILQQMAAIAATKIIGIQAEERVRQMNEQLELLVEQRTQELRYANQEIQRQVEILADQAQSIEVTNTILEEKNEKLSLLNSELDAASRFKTEILSIAAHDLKNPLGVIITSAELIAADVPQDSLAENLVKRVSTTSRSMLNLIVNLLDDAAIDLGAIVLDKKQVVLASVVAAAFENVQVQAITKKQNLTLTTKTKASVVGDEARLYQVIENLLTNAVKYTPWGKSIHVKVEEVGNAALCVSVQDEGPGISPEDMQKLFGKFALLSARPTGGEHSTGLGLSIVKKMVEAMNGRVWCESELGKGATFLVELPTVSGEVN